MRDKIEFGNFELPVSIWGRNMKSMNKKIQSSARKNPLMVGNKFMDF